MVTVSVFWRVVPPLLLITASLSGIGTTHASVPVAPPATTRVYFVAGVTDAVELTVDGRPSGSLAPKEVLGPLPLTRGKHDVEFRSEAWTSTARLELADPSVDVVVHRPADAAGDPVVTAFTNEVKPVAADRARLTVAHTAVVPPADVRVGGKVLFANIANGEFVTAEVPEDTYSVDIVPTGESTPLFGPVDLPVTAGALNRVFAIGQPQNNSMDAIVQVIPLRTTGDAPPTDVKAGSAGLVAPDTRTPDDRGEPASSAVVTGLAGLAVLGLVLMALAPRVPRRRRSRHASG